LSSHRITKSDRDGIVTLCLNRPPANAIDISFLEEIEGALVEIEQRSGVRAMVLTGHGSVFSAGLDLKEVPRYDRLQQNRLLVLLNQVFRRLYALPIPVVAAVNGHAIAGGLVLALACDWRVAVDGDVLLGLTEVRVGVPFPVAAMAVVRSELAPPVARELVLAGKNHGSARSLSLGIVDELRPAGVLLERAEAVARELAAGPAEGYRRIKHQLRQEALSQMARALAGADPLHDNWFLKETQTSAARVLQAG